MRLNSRASENEECVALVDPGGLKVGEKRSEGAL
jgi:hypothetical protein